MWFDVILGADTLLDSLLMPEKCPNQNPAIYGTWLCKKMYLQKALTRIISTAQAVLLWSVGSGIQSSPPVPHFGLSVQNCSKWP